MVLTRRAFTLDAALAILAGCVITVTDEGCHKSSPAAPTPATPADITGTISANHGHIAIVTGATIAAGNAVALNIQGNASHPHTVQLSQGDLLALKNKQPVSVDSSTDNSHKHTVTFTPV